MDMATTPAGERILVVDDESSISDLISTSLKFVGFDVRTAATGSEALRIAEEFKPHAMILDVMLPDLDGFEVCRQIRNEGTEVGVLFLSAKDEMKDKVQGLTIGGDDYMTKPFSLEELVARLRALLRRIGVTERDVDEEKIRFADLELNEATHEARRAGNLLELSPTEFTLLRYLLINADRVVSKAQILDHVWNYDFGGDAVGGESRGGYGLITAEGGGVALYQLRWIEFSSLFGGGGASALVASASPL